MNLRKNIFVRCSNPNRYLDLSNIFYLLENKNRHQIFDFPFGTNMISIAQLACYIYIAVDHSFTDSISACYFVLFYSRIVFSFLYIHTYYIYSYSVFFLYLPIYHIVHLAWLYEHILSSLLFTIHTHVFQFLLVF